MKRVRRGGNSTSVASKKDDGENSSALKDAAPQLVTPMKVKNKASKSENAKDVHSCSTSPRTPKSHYQGNSSVSPVSPFTHAYAYYGTCSQDLPEIIWDFNSPKHKGPPKVEITMTIDDLLKNMRHISQDSPSESDPSSHFKLLEKWMKINKISPAAQTGFKRNFKRTRKPSKSLIDKMQQFLESLTSPDKSEGENSSLQEKSDLKEGTSIGGSENNMDLAENFLWGEETDKDDSLLVSATQEFEQAVMVEGVSLNHNNENAASTWPETTNDEEKKSDLSALLDASDCDWDLVFEDNDWVEEVCNKTVVTTEKMDTSAKSKTFMQNRVTFESYKATVRNQKTDEVRLVKHNGGGSSKTLDEVDLYQVYSSRNQSSNSATNSENLVANQSRLALPKAQNHAKTMPQQGSNSFYHNSITNSLQNRLLPHKEQGSYTATKIVENSSAILETKDAALNNFSTELDLFGDESDFDEPHVWAILDKVELQEKIKCTPEEIAKKKQEALKRLREKLNREK